jgi:hypothetical protein
LREQLETIKKKTGKLPPEYEDQKELPDYLADIWGYFLQLDNKRTSNGFGVNPITYSDLKSFCDLKGVCLEDYQVDLIMRLDNMRIKHYDEEMKKQQDLEKAKSKSRK